ncbi:MAG: nickel-dependent lactate racemase [Euryarchaeota archaeon]|nr:nickel-dependent lactate racemase [Euryarchaeota archaeon]
MRKAHVALKYGKRETSVNLEKANVIQVIEPHEIEAQDEHTEVMQALQNPIGTGQLQEIIDERRARGTNPTVVIIVSDITRPTPTSTLLPHVLDALHSAKVASGQITIVFALGIHRLLTSSEMERLVGQRVFDHYRCVNHDPNDCLYVGTTKQGTQVYANPIVVNADVKICLGTVELHYFAGYSGGYKSLLPGICSRKTIEANHKLMLKPDAAAGRLDSPVRRDLEEAGELIGCDFVLNIVLNPKKQIVRAVAGHPVYAHREGVKTVDSMYIIPIKELADVVIVSAGGAPKDINLFQSQKALDNAQYALKEGGSIILAAECPEGLGERVFERWVNEARNKQELIDRLDYAFEIGGHKAGLLAKLAQKADVYVVSELEKELAERAFLLCAHDLNDALQATQEKYGPDATVIVMPHGAYTLPRFQAQICE